MLQFYVYILRCSDGSYYTGHTDNMDKRLAEHQLGTFDGYTSKRLPVKLMFVEDCGTRCEALEAERRIKGWSRKKKQVLIEKGWEAMRGIWRTQ